MKRLEQIAREQCRIDLMARGLSGPRLNAHVDRFWPVIAAEIYGAGATIDGEWRFSASEIGALRIELGSVRKRL